MYKQEEERKQLKEEWKNRKKFAKNMLLDMIFSLLLDIKYPKEEDKKLKEDL